MDATRVGDGRFVVLKFVQKSRHPFEAEIGSFFSAAPLATDPANHCVPIYEILQVPDEEDVILLVMPLLRRYDDPRFDTFGEVLEFFRQIFEVQHLGHICCIKPIDIALGITIHA
jgi:hypothetical protein